MQRRVSIDVCDYNNTLCNLYDSTRDISGQATEVFIHCERNGFKELSFQLPSKCHTDEGEERNYRLDYLISDYRIKFQVIEDGNITTDWFLVSETKITHQAFSENYEIRAGHLSKLLNTKKLDLEFSDEEGNNTGTIDQIAAVILDGTGWHLRNVAKFYEDKKYGQPEDKEKVRSFNASTQTGAFKMMSDLCELFDAKPMYFGEGRYVIFSVEGTNPDNQDAIYGTEYDKYEADKAIEAAHNEGWTNLVIEETGTKTGRVVDILPMNPFSEELEEGAVPQDVLENNVLELHYDKNVKDITRTLNTENLITRLYAYGSYGDRNGYCSLQNATHTVLIFPNIVADVEYKFVYNNTNYYFITTEDESELRWSCLDFMSQTYVYNLSNKHIYKVYGEPHRTSHTTLTYTGIEERNYFPFIMDFRYYQKIGLLTNYMLKKLALFQMEVPQKYEESEQASLNLSEAQNELFNNASSDNGYAKLAINNASISTNTNNISYGQLVLYLDKSEYSDGVVYRTDFTANKRTYFTWSVANTIKDNGESISAKGSVVYIVNQGDPTTWLKSYVKLVGNSQGFYFFDDLGNYYVLSQRRVYDTKEYDGSTKTYFPATGSANIVYVARDTNKMYVWKDTSYVEIKACNYTYGLSNFEEPSVIALWCSETNWHNDSLVYLFSSDSIAGVFGPREDSVNANRESIEQTLKVATVTHPIYFVAEDDPAPSVDLARQSYGWYYRSYMNTFDLGDLYFCWGTRGTIDWSKYYKPVNPEPGDTNWEKVYVSKGTEDPEINPVVSVNSEYGYYYSFRQFMLYKPIDGHWAPLDGDSSEDNNVKAAFKSVLAGCIKQEVLTKGVLPQYYYDIQNSDLVNREFPIGNYAFKNEYDNYWLFTTDMALQQNDRIRYYTDKKTIWLDEDEHHIVKSVEYSFDLLNFPVSNELKGITFKKGYYDATTYVFSEGTGTHTGTSCYICNAINGIHESTAYQCSLPVGFTIVFQDSTGECKGTSNSTSFVTPEHTTRIRIAVPSKPSSSHYLRVRDYNKCFFVKDTQYKVLNCVGTGDERNGIYNLMDRFISLSDKAYGVELPKLRAAQNQISQANLDLMNLLGDMYREGYWQQNDYVEENIPQLYADALDNLKEVSHPEATYEISYLDLYEQDKNVGLSVDESFEDVPYPDIDISYAAHLVDQDIDINCWAYIDKIDKCFDQPWKTTIEINTKLSMIGQQSFTDVMSHIAEIANETRANQTIYKRASAIGSNGSLATERLEGAIQASKVYLLGGVSNWYTDDKGNIVFENGDGNSAMMLTGRGLMISQEKDEYGDWTWRTALTGQGMTADAIYTGYLSAERIEAGSITANKLSADVGSELEISSNQALALFATTDGNRPAGSLMTSHPAETDSWIDISAKTDTSPAHIAIKSGGAINLESQSSMTISADSTLRIEAGSEFLVNSPNFKIQKNNQNQYVVTVNGNITARSGEIAGFTIGEGITNGQVTRRFLYTGMNNFNDTSHDGVYIGTDGIALGKGKFKVSPQGDATITGTITATDGSIGGWTVKSTHIGNASTLNDSTIGLTNKTSGIVFWAGAKYNYTDANHVFYVKADGTMKAKKGYLGNWTIDGDGIKSSDSNVGVYNSSDTAMPCFWAGGSAKSAKFRVKKDGTVYTSNITAEGGKIGKWIISDSHIGNKTTLNDSTVGLTNKTSGIVFWAGKKYTTADKSHLFYVKDDGSFRATVGYIGNWVLSSDGFNSSDGSVGMHVPKDDLDACFWAASNSGSFAVLKTGQVIMSNMWATGGKIAEWKINGTKLTSTNGTCFIDTKDYSNPSSPVPVCRIADFRLDKKLDYTELTCSRIYGKYVRASITWSGTTIYGAAMQGSSSSGDIVLMAGNLTSPQFKVTGAGVLTATGTVTPSSKDKKHNINLLKDRSEDIDKLNPVSFIYNSDESNRTHFGLIYEDVEKLIPEICYKVDGSKSLNYVELIPLLIKEIQSLKKRISCLEKEGIDYETI